MKWLCFVLLFPALAFAGEDCSMVGGRCKEVCAADEVAEKGAFLDCSDKQGCCVKHEVSRNGEKKSLSKAKTVIRNPEQRSSTL